MGRFIIPTILSSAVVPAGVHGRMLAFLLFVQCGCKKSSENLRDLSRAWRWLYYCSDSETGDTRGQPSVTVRCVFTAPSNPAI